MRKLLRKDLGELARKLKPIKKSDAVFGGRKPRRGVVVQNGLCAGGDDTCP